LGAFAGNHGHGGAAYVTGADTEDVFLVGHFLVFLLSMGFAQCFFGTDFTDYTDFL
jgi:hypothetical protein